MSAVNLDWQKIDTVLLDMDGTLLDLHFDNFFWLNHLPAAYARHCHLSFDEALQNLTIISESHRGTLQWYCLDFWSRKLDLDIPKLKAEIQHLIQPREGAIEFLRALQAINKRVVLVTNAHPDSIELKMFNSELGDYLDRVLSAHDLGAPKEEVGFWSLLQAKEPFDKDRTLFIDDTLSVLVSAEAYGIGIVLGVSQPDSQKPAVGIADRFPLVENFSDLQVQI